ncbi:MAG: hypothetical protein SCM11_06120, partial [Bacillota bacterium]|nr:hypothetical protein [Bacillota bacterium]
MSVIIQIREWDDVIIRALDEDRGNGDVTTRATIPEETSCPGRFLAKETGVICGLPVLVRTYALIDERIRVDCQVT